jgi:hypothetical protein
MPGRRRPCSRSLMSRSSRSQIRSRKPGAGTIGAKLPKISEAGTNRRSPGSSHNRARVAALPKRLRRHPLTRARTSLRRVARSLAALWSRAGSTRRLRPRSPRRRVPHQLDELPIEQDSRGLGEAVGIEFVKSKPSRSCAKGVFAPKAAPSDTRAQWCRAALPRPRPHPALWRMCTAPRRQPGRGCGRPGARGQFPANGTRDSAHAAVRYGPGRRGDRRRPRPCACQGGVRSRRIHPAPDCALLSEARVAFPSSKTIRVAEDSRGKNGGVF